MGSREKNLLVFGPNGAGKATTIGCMLFKYGGIDMLTMERFQQEGIQTYDQAANNLKSLKIAPAFSTPKHHVTIEEAGVVQADCAIVVLSADTLASWKTAKEDFGAAKLIILINKMDVINWSEGQFRSIVEGLGYDTENVPIIPISALHGDNVFEKVPYAKCPWYEGWKMNGKRGTSLLDALDASLET